jgi:hypothetical protein
MHHREADPMAERLLELTRVDTEAGQRPVLVNWDRVAWIEPDDTGATRGVFAVGLQYDRANGILLAILVGESLEQMTRMINVVGRTDEAMAQAWADQTARRPSAEDAP